MKNLFLSFITLLAFSFGANASSIDHNFNAIIKVSTAASIKSTNAKTEISVKFNSAEEFDKYNPKSMEIYTLCDVTVTVSVGAGSTYASATVTAKDINCDDLVAVIRQLKASARAALL